LGGNIIFSILCITADIPPGQCPLVESHEGGIKYIQPGHSHALKSIRAANFGRLQTGSGRRAVYLNSSKWE
jgi:hypothetical protein